LAAGAKETGLVSLFKGASILNRKGEPVSVITQLKDKVVLLYFASTKIEKIDRFNKHLKEFHDIVAEGSGEAPVIIFVSNDGSKENQMKLFQGMSESWLCVEFSAQLQDIANNFGIEMIPAVIVTDKNGKAVVKKGVEELSEVFRIVDDEARKQAYLDKWLEWRKLAGDWRVSGGYTLSGGATSSAAAASSPSAADAASDRDAMRAARLARLGAGPRGGCNAPAGGGGASSSSAGPADVAAAAAASSASSAAAPAAASSSASAAAPKVATLADASRQGYVGGTYTLAGGPVLPPPEATAFAAAEDNMSHMASDGDMSPRDDADLGAPNFEDMQDSEENLAILVSMGFDQESAKAALSAAKGNVDDALAMMLD